MTGRLDEGRLRDQAASPRPGLYADIARGWIAALEQRAERGDAPAPAEVEAALDLAARSAGDLARWWSGAGAAPGG